MSSKGDDHGGHRHGGPHAHKAHAPRVVRVAVVTVSDTRTAETDTSGRLMSELLAEAGHEVVSATIVPDEVARIQPAVSVKAAEQGADAVIVTGGSGIGPRDVTIEAVRELLTKELPGFGELFRMLSFEEIGSAAMLSRSVAGAVGERVVFALPGSRGAVRLAMTRLILPELPHLVHELRGRR